ncbi:MAG: DUF4492 domain-containing protein [Muribaculaceae bacterium]|nr:DUF4492 domain-containing protein [Muribaculaceae bacterium]
MLKLFELYRDGFGNSKLARQLLWLIIIKVAILLLVFKLWLMPNRLSKDFDSDAERADHVRSELIDRR